MTMNADLTVSDVAKYLGPPSISVHPDTRVATGPVFHTVISDCWSQPEALATFLREYSSKGGIVEHMAQSSLTENPSVSFQTFSAKPMIPGPHAEYSGSDLAAVQSEKHQAELELRGAAAEISITSFSRGSGPQRWMMSLRSIARGWEDLRNWSTWTALVNNVNPYIQGSAGTEFFPTKAAKVRSTLNYFGAANKGPINVASAIEQVQTALMGSGISLDRGMTHESVIKRLQAAVSVQNVDAAFATDSIAKRQREGPYADNIRLGGLDLRGTYFTQPQSLHNLAGAASMMSSRIRCPTFTLVFDDKWRYQANRALNGDEAFASLKASTQSTRGFMCRPLAGLKKAGVFSDDGSQISVAFQKSLNLGNRTPTISEVCKAIKGIDGAGGKMVDVENFFKTIYSKKKTELVNKHGKSVIGAPYMPMEEDGEAAFGGANMGADASQWDKGDTSTSKRVLGDKPWTQMKFNVEDLTEWFDMGMSLPIVCCFVNWSTCYTGHALAMSSGKAVYDLHSSGDAMIEKRAANQTMLFHHTMSTASILAQKDMAVTLPAFAVTGYAYGDSDTIRDAKPNAGDHNTGNVNGVAVEFGENATVSDGSLHVHLVPLTDKSGTEQVLFMNGQAPSWVTEGNNVIGEADEQEEVYFGNWGIDWARRCGYDPEKFKGYNSMIYNSCEANENTCNPVAVKGTYFLYDYMKQRHSELSQGIDIFADISGPASFDWRVGKRGFW